MRFDYNNRAVRNFGLRLEVSRQKLSLSLRDYVRKVQREEMDKYIHDDSKEDTVALADLLKDRIKG
jgi:ribosomal protein S1